MTKQLEGLISSEIADFFAGVVDIHTELFGPNTIEETQQKLTERVTRIATEREAKLIAALEQSQKQNADLKRDELLSDELAAAAAKELRRVENLYTESQKRVAELEAVPVVIAWIYEDELPDNYPYDAMFPHSKVDVVRMFPVFAPTGGIANGGE
ncbi:hypothetical protein [Klebsiella sp. BIGb0407]|uniref:hypothetical protein n=1 Tax=Klebsiella sp. BIGb0407 TaxID=2940603 RepID=UPI002167B768|nr:hypothetical protein [Klebsiella sp. BIGb0407]MCS3433671.1 hypothetical protein [Klebsiella sp. BIGb0407]